MQFRDLKRQYQYMKNKIDANIAEVISSAHFISGGQVKTLEDDLASYVGVKHCISCANGTDAISIALLAYGVGAGDAVFVPDFTFFSSGECPAAVGAVPVFVDVLPSTYNMDPISLEQAIKKVLDEGELTPRVVVAVDLFGQPFDYEGIRSICDTYGLMLLEDAAQGFGGYINTSVDAASDHRPDEKKEKRGRRMACSLGDISTTSFFPAKPLGCYGDGGAVFTDDDRIAYLSRSIAVHGKDMERPDDPNAKYKNVRIGMNSRLDTIQAGVLLAKFPVFCDEELDYVNHMADIYASQLSDVQGLVLPAVKDNYYSSWAQYTVQLPQSVDRKAVQERLRTKGIPTNIYYMMPMHKQGAFAKTRSAVADCPITERLCETVLCLPIHPYLTEEEVNMVCHELKAAIAIKK